MQLFVTGSGTNVGKTTLSVGLLRQLSADRSVLGLKPFETGVEGGVAQDARALYQASNVAWGAWDDLYRVPPPLAPLAATSLGHASPDLEALRSKLQEAAQQAEVLLIEGAGGPLVPLTRDVTIADFFASLAAPGDRVIWVSDDRLGVLSHTLEGIEALRRRGLTLSFVLLNQREPGADLSQATNALILRELLEVPVFVVGHQRMDALAEPAALLRSSQTGG